MTPLELRSSLSLATIFALRMLGLFLVLPVFALEAAKFPGGDDPAKVGLAMGIYGLTQGLLQLPFEAVHVVRPAFVQPLGGIRSRTSLYRAFYAVTGPIFPLVNAVAPKYVTTTERIGRAMLAIARRGAPKPVLENHDLNDLGEQ